MVSRRAVRRFRVRLIRDFGPPFFRGAAPLVLLGLFLACSTAPRAVTPSLEAAAELDEVRSSPRQELYRVTFDGPAGSGTLRLVLRWESPRRFDLLGSGPLGQALWVLSVDGGGAWFADHREQSYCRDVSSLPIDGWPAEIELRAVPRLLGGEVPVEIGSVPGQLASKDWKDDRGNRWRARFQADRAESWSMWDEQGPRILWQRDGEGGILSNRVGGWQVRWRQITSEPLPDPLTDAGPPADYREGRCHDASPVP